MYHRKLILKTHSNYNKSALREYCPFLFSTDIKMEHQELSHEVKRRKFKTQPPVQDSPCE